jgi:hypothetical protein
MTNTPIYLFGLFLLGFLLGWYLSKVLSIEGFQNDRIRCDSCGDDSPCHCPKPSPRVVCPARPECKQPDMSKYVLKSTIPPCPTCPDLSNYILKSECPPVPDLSNYVLKSSIPKQNPILLDCSKCHKPKGECPPCPRARCPEVKCPPPTKCPACAPCPRSTCPPAVLKVKAEQVVPSEQQLIRPYLTPLHSAFGSS